MKQSIDQEIDQEIDQHPNSMTNIEKPSPTLSHQHHDATKIPVTKIVFLKTHKTGSSTLQNIFYRYGTGFVYHNLDHFPLGRF